MTIPYQRGLKGRSDGDVLLHALADALLGACGLGDIGERFSDSDPRTEGMDSREIVRAALAEIAQKGFRLENADTIVHAEAPRIGPHRDAIRTSLAELLGVDPERVGLKAKTAEGLGEIGRGEAIAAEAVVLLRGPE